MSLSASRIFSFSLSHIPMKVPFVSWLAFLFCHWIILCGHISVVFGQCLEDQRSLLLQLKNELTSHDNSFNVLATWNQHPDCCEWAGISCDSEDHVVGLNLNNQNITGEINDSSSLFSLEYLQDLNLAYKNFNSVFPSGFHKLTNLMNLNLSCAGFVGQIPFGISHLTQLVTLHISCCFFQFGNHFCSDTGSLRLENPNLKTLVQNLTSLKKLHLGWVNSSTQGQEWCSSLLSLSSLQELNLQGCHLSGPMDCLAKLEHLSVIVLDDNILTNSVPESFDNIENLTTLSLFGCDLRGMFPKKIFQLRTLSYIDISLNEDLRGSFPDFPLNGSLKTLRVLGTGFFGAIPNSISNLKQLSELNLAFCQFNGTLPVSMSKLTQLVELVLSYNGFTGPIPSFNKCKKLFYMLLGSNNFTGPLPSTHFEGLLNVVGIDLHNNSITGHIPLSIFLNPSVKKIDVSGNKFNGQLDGFIFSSGIEFLDLSKNNFEGPIPQALFELKQLMELQLSFNRFSGKVDLNMIQNLSNLHYLDLSYNNLAIIDSKISFPSLPSISSLRLISCQVTTFPELLKNQSTLETLDVSNNHLVGTVPHWLSNLSSLYYLNVSYNHLTSWEEPLLNNMSYIFQYLEYLDFSNNNFRSSLPVLPRNLEILDCSNNNFSSFIPPNIGSYSSGINYISFSGNNFHGNIPESLCNASNLEALDLSNNHLTGKIPKCLIAMNGTLSILNLQRNKLTGTIESFPGLCDLRTLNLNGNFLQGELPKYLVNCAMLQVLDVGNNQIDSEFPCWLKNLSTLHVVILGSNKFHGSLKCLETQVAWPYLQIVDLAHNNFRGRIPPTFLGMLKALMSGKNDGKLLRTDLFELSFSIVYYQDKVTLTSKNLQIELVKIQRIFTSIDLSSNKFEGPIPDELGQLRALHILNLSHNAFSGSIPSSIGTLMLLESLDLSNNSLTGEIPAQMAKLSFLSFLNLSFNHLVGRIPSGTQIQSFEASSFIGNDGLCGQPLTPNCSSDEIPRIPQSSIKKSRSGSSIDWHFISPELGFVFGIGIVLLPLAFWKPWRIWYWQHVDDLLYRIFPQLDFVYECRGGKNYRTLRWKSH